MHWHRIDGTIIELPILKAVEIALIQEQIDGNDLKVCIGTDSQCRQGVIEYASVIVFIRRKRGGFMFISHHSQPNNISLRERLITEVSKSVAVAYELCPLLDSYEIPMEVHADINTDPHFKSNQALSEAMGYILGMGFTFKAKPDSYASTSCANKVV